ncbi:hypothetical protein BKA65DRAFT_86266 [Rhexocercosporidium sp. MPI-PUGE-AT-0058]|nr:hypothetical protein BKA65DRAFT_86266 [Rhexocercosporidium sp. MPI-PUGE-AT-0058]
MKKRTAPVSTRPPTAPRAKIKRKKRRFMLSTPKRGFYLKKRPAFDAFEIKSSIDNGMGKMVGKVEVVEPETGIHSQAWALEIKPQNTPFFQIPLEIRTRIFEILFHSYDLMLSPQKRGKRFVNTNDGLRNTLFSSPIKTYLAVSLICRQAYVEVVGGALLYRMGDFHFKSGLLMSNYLSRINPFHVSSITRITLTLRLTKSSQTIPKKITDLLATTKTLKHLTITLSIDTALCEKDLLAPNLWKYHNLKEDLCAKIESAKNWKVLKGLRSFEMKFKSFRCRGGYIHNSDIDSPRLKAVGQEIEKVVMRTE